MFINELDDLEDILNSLVFEDEPSIFNEEYSLELVETALHLMDKFVSENPTIISEPMFQDILLEEIKELFYIQFEDEIFENDDIEDDMNELLEKAIDIFTISFNIERSINQENIGFIENNESENEINIIEQKIQILRNAPQPEQRTSEWYQFRWNLITASNAYKAFESQPTINQLIYEKCLPMNTEKYKPTLNENSLTWGHKYEPLSNLIYEMKMNTKVKEFGCIEHPTYKFLAASPDGIVVGENNYGRMLEIKNVVSRVIDGCPKKEYYIQMQLQMEVCNLDECDFVETKFIEYDGYQQFIEDTDDKEKGLIVVFIEDKKG
jgi:putative phage-type endonuclease